MENTQTLNQRLEAITWGLLFIWWGLRWWPLIALPEGTGLVGTGLILLGLNAARSLNGIPMKSGTTILGILALEWGALLAAGQILNLPFEVPVFEILLISLGVIILAQVLLSTRRQPALG